MALGLVFFLFRRRQASFAPPAALAVAIAAGCDPQAASQPLASCVQGVWLTSSDPCLCESVDGAPECAALDCSYQGYRWFLDDGTLRFGFVMSSVTAATFSTTAAPSVQEWSLSDDRLTLRTPDGNAEPLTQRINKCDSNELVWGASLRSRASRTISESFASAYSADGWTEQPYRGP